MNRKNTLILSLAIAATVLCGLSSCSKGSVGPAGPAGPSYVAKVSGFVSLYDQYGTRMLSGLSGIQATVTGSTKTAITDVNGRYEIDSLVTGNYTINYTDPAATYGADQISDVQIVTGDVNHDVKLSQKPTFTLASVSAMDTTLTGIGYVRLTITLSAPDTRARTVAVFAGTSSSVSSATANYTLNISKAVAANTTVVYQYIPYTDLYGAGIAAGGTVYFSVYAAAANYTTTSSYEDLTNGRTVYNAIGSNGITASAAVH